MSMEAYMSHVKPLDIDRIQRKKRMEKVSDKELSTYQVLAGELVWIGCGALPQAAFAGSSMQQSMPRLTVEDLRDANSTLKELKDLPAIVKFRTPPMHTSHADVFSFSDAAFNVSSTQIYGQTGLITGIRMNGSNTEPDILHLIDWTSAKQRRVSYSSYGAEILACTDADDRGYRIKQALKSISPGILFDTF